MKKLITIMLVASASWAADFSQISTEEMMNMRGSVPANDRSDFREEMQKRMQSMSPEERQKYMQTRGMGQGKGMMGGKQNYMRDMPTFEQYDLNNDGKVTKNELEEARTKRMTQKAKEGKMLRNAGNAPAFNDMDTNNDGSLNREEFNLHQTVQIKKSNKGPCVADCPGRGMMNKGGNAPTFADIDSNKDGVISQEEFRSHQNQRMQNKVNCPSGNCP